MEPRLRASTVFEKNLEAYNQGYRIIMNQGGSRSSKSFSIMQLLVTIALSDNQAISVTSCAFPHLRRGSLRDWRTIMEDLDIYDPEKHVKTEQVYYYDKKSYIEFFSVDNNLKVRGPGRDILFINEANLIDFDTFQQLILRTRKCIFLDYNPSDEFHWLYEHVETRPDCKFIKSTYLDNPFLPHEQVKEIENLRNVDENFWRIYGEGERGHSEGVIYTHWKPASSIPSGTVVFGLDFGFNNPTSLVKVTENDQNLYWKEEFYQAGVTNPELIQVLKQFCKPHDPIYCDAAEPARIEEIKRAGLRAIPANKNVKEGIDFVKSRKLFIHSQSVNMLKEIKSYKYKNKGKKLGNEPEEPLKLNDHCFTGDSLVMTNTGARPISEIQAGDYVLTSKGLRTVLRKWNNGQKLIKSYWLHFDTISLNLTCTPEHLIRVGEGWTQISKLESGMMVSLSSSSMAGAILSIQGNDILEALSMQCTGTYGNITVAKGREDSMFTTLTRIHGTTELKTLSLKKQRNIFQTILKKGTKMIKRGRKSLRKKVLKPLKHGIKALRVCIGIDSTHLKITSEIKPTGMLSVKFAELLSKDKQPPTNFAIQTAKLKRFEEGEESLEQVFDLTIDEEHEYFVNGVLVHNCMDAARYASISFKKPKQTFHSSFHKV